MRMRCLLVGLLGVALERRVGAAGVERLIPIPQSHVRRHSIRSASVRHLDRSRSRAALRRESRSAGWRRHIDVDHDRYTSVDFKSSVLSGRGRAARLLGGRERRISPLQHRRPIGRRAARSLDAPTLGVLVDYNWMLGVNRRFLVGTGVGAKRVLAGGIGERRPAGLGRAYRHRFRFVIGYAF